MKTLLLLAFLLLGCQTAKHQYQGDEGGNHGKRESKAQLRTKRNSISSNEKSIQPTDAFLSFTNYLDSSGYISDTARAQITELSLNRSKIGYFENKPFYVLVPKNHAIQQTKQFLKNFKKFDTLTVDFDIFLRPISIFAYYYRQKNKSELIEDGVIEEWHFSSKNEAQQAFTEINKMKEFVYVNTSSLTLVRENKLYIFHTRASAFDITLGNFYERFKERLK